MELVSGATCRIPLLAGEPLVGSDPSGRDNGEAWAELSKVDQDLSPVVHRISAPGGVEGSSRPSATSAAFLLVENTAGARPLRHARTAPSEKHSTKVERRVRAVRDPSSLCVARGGKRSFTEILPKHPTAQKRTSAAGPVSRSHLSKAIRLRARRLHVIRVQGACLLTCDSRRSSCGSRLPTDASEADMAHTCVHHLSVPRRRAIAAAVGRRAEEGAALHDLAWDRGRWLVGFVACFAIRHRVELSAPQHVGVPGLAAVCLAANRSVVHSQTLPQTS